MIESSGIAEAHGDLLTFVHSLARAMIQHRQSGGTDAALKYGLSAMEERLGCDEMAEGYERELGQAGDGDTARKIEDGISWFDDLTSNNLDKLFDVKPTPVPELPLAVENQVVDTLEVALLQRITDRMGLTLQETGLPPNEAFEALKQQNVDFVPSDDEIEEMAQRLKSKARSTVDRYALDAAKKVSTRIQDILLETGMSDTWRESVVDFFWSPYVVWRRVNHYNRKRTWSGNKFKIKTDMMPHARRVAPQNFYWTADSTTPRDGTAVGDVVRLREFELAKMIELEDNEFIKSQIRTCLSECRGYKESREWMARPDWTCSLGAETEGSDERNRSPWMPGSSAECLRISGLINVDRLDCRLGIELKGDYQQVEMEVWLVDQWIVRFEVHEVPEYRRPYYLVPYQRVPGKMHGRSFPQRLQAVEQKARSTDRAIVRNLGWSSAPISTKDKAQFPNAADVPGVPVPGDSYTVDSLRGSSQKALEFYVMPNNVNQMRAYRADLSEQADLRSGIPRFALGQTTQLPSALRSTSMLAAMIGNATKTIKRHITDMSRGLMVPFVEDLHEWLMLDADTPDDLKVDAGVVVGGIEALIQKDFVTSQLRDWIQYLAPFVREGQIPQEVVDKLLYKVLSETGIDTSDLDNDDDLVNAGATELTQLNPASGTPVLDGRSAVQTPVGIDGQLAGLS